MARITTIALAALIGLGFTPLNMADTLSIVDQPNGIERPVKGMHMDQVRGKFGDPREILDPVGDPPITRWVYEGFTVYYEYKYVIHSVVHRDKSKAPADDGGPLFIAD